MLSTHNMVLPSNGEPVVVPTLDMVLGCYYLTSLKQGAKGEGMVFASSGEAELAYDLDAIALGAEINVRQGGERRPVEDHSRSHNLQQRAAQGNGISHETVDKGMLKRLIGRCLKLSGHEAAAAMVDSIKHLGFKYSTDPAPLSVSMT